MAQYDMPLAELRAYAPALAEPADFDAFWAETLEEARTFRLGAQFDAVETGLTEIDTWDVTFRGFGGTKVRAWLRMPRHRQGRLPAVVEYQGYGNGRGLAHEKLLFAAAGYAHLVMDTRGQGSAGSVGVTPDPGAGSAPSFPGFMTDGITDPATYYYRRLYTDAVRAVEAVRAHPDVDPGRVVVTGGSQGGGLTIAVAGLVPDLAGAAPDVPFLCNFPRALAICDKDPYLEITRYLRVHRDHVGTVARTLSYVDGVSLARRANTAALFSVGLMDLTCPPSTVYAAFNAYAGSKRMVEYPYNDHEGGGAFQELEKLRWLADLFGP